MVRSHYALDWSHIQYNSWLIFRFIAGFHAVRQAGNPSFFWAHVEYFLEWLIDWLIDLVTLETLPRYTHSNTNRPTASQQSTTRPKHSICKQTNRLYIDFRRMLQWFIWTRLIFHSNSCRTSSIQSFTACVKNAKRIIIILANIIINLLSSVPVGVCYFFNLSCSTIGSILCRGAQFL